MGNINHGKAEGKAEMDQETISLETMMDVGKFHTFFFGTISQGSVQGLNGGWACVHSGNLT